MDQFARQIVLYTLRAYKWMISPLLPPACRYVPTCSDYAMEAVERYGAVRGSWLALRRLLRCHPFVKGGYDPVVKRTVAEPLVQHTVSECKHTISQTATDSDAEERRFQTAESATSKPRESGVIKSSKRNSLKLWKSGICNSSKRHALNLWKSGALAPRNSAKPLTGFSPRTGLNV